MSGEVPVTKKNRILMIKEALTRVLKRRQGVLLRDNKHSYNAMMAEVTRQSEPASTEVEPKKDCPDCTQRRPAPTIGQYESSMGDKGMVEGRRSESLGTPQKNSMAGTLDEARKNSVALELLDSEVQSVREELGSDIEENNDLPSRSVRNPTGHKRSTSLDTDPRAGPDPEEVLLEKEQKGLKGKVMD